jgi:hypothetical protein
MKYFHKLIMMYKFLNLLLHLLQLVDDHLHHLLLQLLLQLI